MKRWWSDEKIESCFGRKSNKINSWTAGCAVGLLTGRSKILAELSLKMISLASSRSAWLLGVQAGPCGDTASSKEPGPLRCRGHQHSSATARPDGVVRCVSRARGARRARAPAAPGALLLLFDESTSILSECIVGEIHLLLLIDTNYSKMVL